MLSNSLNIYTGTKGTGTSYLLDDYGSAERAFSVARKLKSDYSGDCIRVRESGSDTEADIGFDIGGNMDETALLAHCGANSGYITTVYDQSGNGVDWTQSTANLQPRIVNAGTTDKLNGKPVAYCNNDKYWNCSLTIAVSETASFFGVFKHSTTRALFFHDGISYWVGRFENGNSGNSYANSGTPTNSVNDSVIGNTQDNLFDAIDGNHVIFSAVNATLANSWNNFEIGMSSVASIYSPDYFQEAILYFSDQTSNETDINTNINSYYGVY